MLKRETRPSMTTLSFGSVECLQDSAMDIHFYLDYLQTSDPEWSTASLGDLCLSTLREHIAKDKAFSAWRKDQQQERGADILARLTPARKRGGARRKATPESVE